MDRSLKQSFLERVVGKRFVIIDPLSRELHKKKYEVLGMVESGETISLEVAHLYVDKKGEERKSKRKKKRLFTAFMGSRR